MPLIVPSKGAGSGGGASAALWVPVFERGANGSQATLLDQVLTPAGAFASYNSSSAYLGLLWLDPADFDAVTLSAHARGTYENQGATSPGQVARIRLWKASNAAATSSGTITLDSQIGTDGAFNAGAALGSYASAHAKTGDGTITTAGYYVATYKWDGAPLAHNHLVDLSIDVKKAS